MEELSQKPFDHKIGRVMVVDDEVELMTALREVLSAQGYETVGCLNGAEALAVLREGEFDLLLTDLMMPAMDGIELIQAGLAIDPNIIGIIMTGNGTVQTAVDAMKTGAFDYVLKPFKLDILFPLLSRAMQARSMRMENMQLKETIAFHELGKAIAFSSDLNSILNKVADAALQQCSADEVSIMLPTHDGKELYIAVVRGDHMEYIGTRTPIEQGIAGWVARNRESVVLRGDVNDPRMAPIKPRPDIHTSVSMPMLSAGNLVGVLNVNITRSRRQFTLGQLKALGILISIISPILEKTWLHIRISEAEEKYRSIFENAIEGIFQRSPDGRLISVNPAFARIFGYSSPGELMANVTHFVRDVYVDPDRGAEFDRLMEIDGEARNFEYRARRKDGSQAWISVNARAVKDENSVLLYYEGMNEDVTNRRLSESRLTLGKEILEKLNRPNDIARLTEDILGLLKEHTGIKAIGIRLKEGEDYPYYVTNGFSGSFLGTRDCHCVRDDAGVITPDTQDHPILECLCGDVLCGRTDPSLPFFTEGGSFWTNSTTELRASTSENARQCFTRNRCNSEGYESVALIPLRARGEIIGLLQMNDSRRNAFAPDRVLFYEGIGASIGIALSRLRSVEALRESEEKYRLLFENVTDIIFSVDSTMKTLSITPSVKTWLGYRPEEVIGRSIGELGIVAQEFQEEAFSDIQRVLAGDTFPSKMYELIAKDGARRFYEISAAPLLRDGKAAAVVCIARDITERKQAEEWLLRERSMVDRIMKTSPAGITVVNLDGRIIFANQRAQEILKLTKDEPTSLTHEHPAWRMMDIDGVPIIPANLPFLQVISAGVPLYGIQRTIISPDGRHIDLSINAAPLLDGEGNISDVVISIDDITTRRQAENKIIETMEKLRNSINDTIRAIAVIAEAKDSYTAGHQERVSKLAAAIAEEMRLPEEQIEGVKMAGIVHDIGKIKIPTEILSKPVKLSPLEFELIKSHAEIGYSILDTIEFPYPIGEITYQHHEWIDGSGYPRGLKGEEILIEARILAVADTVEAMASNRPYRPALGISAALTEVEKNSGIRYDAGVAEACLRLFREKGFQL